MRIVFVEEEYATGVYEPEKLMIKIIWKGRQTSEQYRATFQKALKLAEERVVRFYISDVRQQRVVSPEDRKWFQEVALPSAIERGLTKAAVIFAGNPFKKYYLNNILNSAKLFGLPLKFFYNPDEAENWLLENVKNG